MKKLILVVSVVAILVGCAHGAFASEIKPATISREDYGKRHAIVVLNRELDYESVKTTKVSVLPEGYIPLWDAIEASADVLDCVYWESQISFLAVKKEKNPCIYQTFLSNYGIIVSYNDTTYVNEEKYKLIYEEALKGNDAKHVEIPEKGNLKNFFKVNTYEENQFKDIKSSNKYINNIKTAFEMDLMHGRKDAMFEPEENITVYETIALACRIRGIYKGNEAVFVHNEKYHPWYDDYMRYADEKAIADVPSYAEGTAEATREFFLNTISKALDDAALIAIKDVESIQGLNENTPYAENVLRLYRAGVLTESEMENILLADEPIKRYEVAAIVSRIADQELRK